mgnify:FL=1|tara:strand:- start:765 stop:1583 length:819 start_codon:yes stop_codon:yes gene_type:complete
MKIKDYHATDHLNSSSVKEGLKSLKRYKFAIDSPSKKSTLAMDEGSAVHCKLGEPHLFTRDFVVKPYGMNFATKEGKAWKAENKGKTIITAEFGDKLKDIEAAFLDSPAAKYYEAEGDVEKSFFWDIAGNDRGGKCRPDWISKDRKTIVDLKTTTCAERNSFQRTIMNYGYHISAAWYMWGIELATGIKPEEFIWVAIEKEAPYGIGVYKADRELLQYGSELCEEALIKINEAERTNNFPDYSDQVEMIGLPPWLKKKEGVTPQNYQEIELY